MYVQGYVTAVPKKNKNDYIELAKRIVPLFQKFGATRVVDAWQDDVPNEGQTSFYGAVKAEEDEAVVLSWLEYPSKEIRDKANREMDQDPELQEMWKNMPFDVKRMISGGFESIMDSKKPV